MNQRITPPTPRWVRVSGIAAVFGILAFVVYHLTGHGFHHHH